MQSGSSRLWVWVLTAILTVVAVGLLNFAVGDVDAQLDLTEDKRFTLPDAAKRIAASLDDVCTVTAYISDPLPKRLDFLPRVLRTRLEEFRRASDGKLTFQFISPDADEVLKAELAKRQPPIAPIPIPDIVEGKQITGNYFLWMVFRYGKEEVAFNLAELNQVLIHEGELRKTLPFQIAAKLVKLINPSMKVGIASEKKAPPQELQRQIGKDPTDGLIQFRQSIERHLPKPEDVSVKGGVQIRDDIDTLVIHRPEGLDERAVFEIDQFLMRGKDVMIFLDNFAIFDLDRAMEFQQGLQSGRVKVRPLDHGLGSWLRHFGVVVEDGFLEDRMHGVVVTHQPDIGPQGMTFREIRKELPALVLASEFGPDKKPTGQFSTENPALAGLPRVGMAFAVPMRVDYEAAKAHGQTAEGTPRVQAEVVIRSSPEAWVRQVEDDTVPLWYPDNHELPDRSEWGSRPLVVAIHGSFKSYFAGKTFGESDRPPRKGADGSALPEVPNPNPKLDASIEPGQLWVFADSDFASDFGLAIPRNLQSQDATMSMNYMLVGAVNVLDTVTVGNDLVEIRRPALVDRSVDPIVVSDRKNTIWFWTVVFAPLVLILAGIVWWVVRAASTRIPSPGGPTRPAFKMDDARTHAAERETDAAPAEIAAGAGQNVMPEEKKS